MLLNVFGATLPDPLADALRSAGFTLEPQDAAPSRERGSTESLAAILREVDGSLQAARPAVVLIAAGGDEGLMATVTAVKLGIPTVVVTGLGETSPIAAEVADLSVPATRDPQEAAAAIRALAAPTLAGK